VCPECGAEVDDPTFEDDDATPSESISPDDRVAAHLKRALSPRIQILRRLAGGGMSVVYLGREPSLRRLVAIKVLADDLSRDAVARARFTREAESAAAIVDPNVISIYQVGTLPRSNKPYIVMQFVDGLTLQQEILSGKQVPEALAKVVVGEIASALATAHSRGVIHRDIKPANVVIDRETGRAIVLDFGISAAMAGRNSGKERLTGEGVSVGTPAYMSPEQAAAREISDRTDVYSLGVLAFELVTGQLPLHADQPEGYIAAHLQDTPPPVQSLRSDLDHQFADLINRCLAKDPDQRPSADEIARALIPPAQPPVEWPPPGLEVLRRAGWRFVRALSATGGAGLAFLALLLFAPASGAWREFTGTGLLPFGNAEQAPGGGATVLLFLLTLSVVAASLFALFALFRGWRLADIFTWARGLGYPWPVLLDVALDSPDTIAIVNGHGIFALTSERKRRRLLTFKRWSAGAIVLATILGVGSAVLWAFGVISSPSSTTLTMVSTREALLVLGPTLIALISAVLFSLPERLIRNRARRWRPFVPLTWTLPKVRRETIVNWLDTADRKPAKPRVPRWMTAAFPVLFAAFSGTALLAVLTITLTAAVTSAQWTSAGRAIADAIAGYTGSPTAHDLTTTVSNSLVGGRRVELTELDKEMVEQWTVTGFASLSEASTTVHAQHQALWRKIPIGLTDEERSMLSNDANRGEIATWRRITRSHTEELFHVADASLASATVPGTDLPMLSDGAVVNLALANEAAALLSMDRGEAPAALLRGRENLAIGLMLLRDPFHGWIAHDVIVIGQRIIREAAYITGDRELLIEAEGLEDVIEALPDPPARVMQYGSTLMGDPVGPRGLQLVANGNRLPYERWWMMASIVPGFCGSPREILFGLHPDRRATIAVAGGFAADLPRHDEWVALNERWFDAIANTETTLLDTEMPSWARWLRWMGLGATMERMRFCRHELERFPSPN